VPLPRRCHTVKSARWLLARRQPSAVHTTRRVPSTEEHRAWQLGSHPRYCGLPDSACALANDSPSCPLISVHQFFEQCLCLSQVDEVLSRVEREILRLQQFQGLFVAPLLRKQTALIAHCTKGQ